MTSAWSQLEQMLTCAICLDKFKNPRLLPCQHSFCGDACMEGLVDYARRQIKCPECRAEHRIPYQGVSSLPSNVTLIRFLELHSRITGEEPEPVPTFMEKCSVCGEKVDGVQRCWHCEKKVCPECKEAHIDLLRREITRINGQSKRCLNKMQEFRETLDRAQERLTQNHKGVRREVEESCRRLIADLQAKQKKLFDELDSYAENEQKTIDKLRSALADELETLESNLRLADDKITNKFPWTDQELSELKEIYNRAMEFVRLFDPEIGDFSRKMRFTLIPDFETLRRRICEIGELKFAESAASLVANSFQYCNATGSVAIELCNAATTQMGINGQSGYGLAHSNSNTNLGGTGQTNMLELPSMQNMLMRSQSDHRLANQFQQRLKQQQLLQKQEASNKNGGFTAGSRYGAGTRDYETDTIRSRYAPPRTSIGSSKDYANDILTRDWPRPSDNDGPETSFGSSIHFKSAFMRRKEKERQQIGCYGGYNNDDDDDLVSESSFGGASSTSRNVRFNDVQLDQQVVKLFESKEVERAPLSGVPKLDQSPHLHNRLHQMGAKAKVDKKNAEEEGKRDKDLVESARKAMSKATERGKFEMKQFSEDEIERQKRVNKQQEQGIAQTEEQDSSGEPQMRSTTRSGATSYQSRLTEAQDSPRHSPTPSNDLNSSASTVVEVESSAASSLPTSSTAASSLSGRRNLYGQAVTERSKRHLSNAIQDAVTYTRRRAAASSSAEGEPTTPEASIASNSSGIKTKRILRSSGRSMSKQSSIDQAEAGTSTGTTQRRRRNLVRGDSSQHSFDSTTAGSGSLQTAASSSRPVASASVDTQSKNSAVGSGGHSDNSQSSLQGSLTAGPKTARSLFYTRTASTVDQTTNTTDEDADPDNLREDETPASLSGLYRPIHKPSRKSDSSDEDDDDEDDDAEDDDDKDEKADKSRSFGDRNSGNRRSRELMSNAVNRLLDRSAQIRHDSQEQRNRGDSPQRVRPRAQSRDYSGPAYRPIAACTDYSSSPSGSVSSSVAGRSRFAYQRSQSIRDSKHLEDEASNNSSIYTTASSGRKSSIDEEASSSARRTSGNSIDRGLTSEHSRGFYRRDSTGDSPAPVYQSRFLARSRTSAALSSASNNNRSQDNVDSLDPGERADSSSSARSYLSSRDRFMQSAGVMSETQAGSSGGYSRSGSSAVLPNFATSNLGQNRHHPASRAYYNDNTPFIEFDDEDDNYSAYFPSGKILRHQQDRQLLGRGVHRGRV